LTSAYSLYIDKFLSFRADPRGNRQNNGKPAQRFTGGYYNQKFVIKRSLLWPNIQI
jgi:hypothetical protein